MYNQLMEKMIFGEKKYFKLVLGLGNCSYSNIEDLCRVYALAGVDIFDLSPNIKSLKSAQNGVKKAGLNPYDFKYCISFGVKGDTHIQKAKINTEKCKRCYKCVSKCPQNAIKLGKNSYPEVDSTKCIGCKRCEKSCIDFFDNETDISATAKDFKGEKLDLVELHASTLNKKEIFKKWEEIIDNFDCPKSICLDRSKYGSEKLIKIIKKLEKMNPTQTIIQADGVPMSGADSASCTLQAIAHAQIYKDLGLPIFLSGGTNSLTKKFADEFEIEYDGITVGSYARAIVKDAINSSDWQLAVKIAQNLINKLKD